jgi:competence protein ComQ
MLHTAALLLDDVEDGELDGKPWPVVGPAEAVNIATALVFAAQLALARLESETGDPTVSLALWQTFNRASLQVCAGQHLDLTAASAALETYWQVAAGKAGQVFALACRVGAMLGACDAQWIARYDEFGYNLGILVQISDDFNGVWNSPGAGDLRAGLRTLPVVYALSVSPPHARKHLNDLLAVASADSAACAEVRRLLVDLGALQYLILQAEVYRRQAVEALACVPGVQAAQAKLLALSDRILCLFPARAELEQPREHR